MTPHDAMEKGIGMVHQEFMLIPGFTITENIKLNREITKPTVLSKIFGKRLQELEDVYKRQVQLCFYIRMFGIQQPVVQGYLGVVAEYVAILGIHGHHEGIPQAKAGDYKPRAAAYAYHGHEAVSYTHLARAHMK